MKAIPEAMKLAALVQQWVDQVQLPSEIELNPEAGTSGVEVPCEVAGQTCRLFVEADEQRHWLSLHLYGAKVIPDARHDEACRLVNAINLRFLSLGRLAAVRGGGFQFKALADVEGSQPSITMIKSMLDSGTHVFKLWAAAFEAIISGDQTTEQILLEVGKTS